MGVEEPGDAVYPADDLLPADDLYPADPPPASEPKVDPKATSSSTVIGGDG